MHYCLGNRIKGYPPFFVALFFCQNVMQLTLSPTITTLAASRKKSFRTVGKEEMLVINFFSFSNDVFYPCGVRSCEIERRPSNHKVPISIPESRCQHWKFSLAHTFGASTGAIPRKHNLERSA